MKVTSLLQEQMPEKHGDRRLLLCKDCIHYQYFRHEGVEICGRAAKLLNPVSGEVVDNWTHRSQAKCETQRSTWAVFAPLFGDCGTRAKFFQKRT